MPWRLLCLTSWHGRRQARNNHFVLSHLLRPQDDVKDSPAARQPKHYSGVNGDVPNQQLIVQVSFG